MEYFKYFQQIEYGTDLATNILARCKIKEYLKSMPAMYYVYTLTDDDRADILADNLYGNYKYTWLIYYANDIVDPTLDWPYSELEFRKYIDHKYGSWMAADQSLYQYINEEGFVVDWTTWANDVIQTMNGIVQPYASDTIINLISSFGTQKAKILAMSGSLVTEIQFLFDNTLNGVLSVDTGGKYVITSLQHELDVNEEKRKIKLIDERYVPQICEEMKNLMKRTSIYV